MVHPDICAQHARAHQQDLHIAAARQRVLRTVHVPRHVLTRRVARRMGHILVTAGRILLRYSTGESLTATTSR
jgi:hypothetical protein